MKKRRRKMGKKFKIVEGKRKMRNARGKGLKEAEDFFFFLAFHFKLGNH